MTSTIHSGISDLSFPFGQNHRPAALSRQIDRQDLFIGGSRRGLTAPGALSGLFLASNLSLRIPVTLVLRRSAMIPQDSSLRKIHPPQEVLEAGVGAGSIPSKKERGEVK